LAIRYPQKSAAKYNNKKVIYEGIPFDSKREMQRYRQLQLLQHAGKIKGLELQKEFELIPTQREPDTIGKRGGVHKGKVIEHKCTYKADFVYTDTETGALVVEDTKGMRTKDYIIKRKLMLYVYGIRIKEI
jgi:hypothetical protein